MKEKVEEVLGRIRNALKMDGGDIELVNVENNVVTVRLKGACAGCPFSQMTIRNFVEKELKKAIPEIEKVEAAPIDEEDEEE
jgi:Fe-S cluster biogenesis protein NfuA